jgi:hypothetical protein
MRTYFTGDCSTFDLPGKYILLEVLLEEGETDMLVYVLTTSLRDPVLKYRVDC